MPQNIKSFLSVSDFSPNEISSLFVDAQKLSTASNSTIKDLQEKFFNIRAVLYFSQSSTRTFLSFQNACHILGIKTSDIRDTKTSSESKGETPLDSLRTFAAYAQIIIMRHADAQLISEAHKKLNPLYPKLCFINAGSGSQEHPTQALLDLYTIEQNGFTENKQITFVGDIKRSRTIKSLCQLFIYLNKNYTLNFVAQDSLQIESELETSLKKANFSINKYSHLEECIQKTDVLYMTRIQDEYGADIENKSNPYALNNELSKQLKQNAIVLHPLPRREELPESFDSDSRAKYWKQEENGLWIRAALICKLFGISLD